MVPLPDHRGGGWHAGPLDSRLVQDRIAATAEARLTRLARRQDVITGVSDFPNVMDRVPPDPVARLGSEGGLPRLRYPGPYEDLRQRTDEYERRHGERPAVLLVQLGTPGEYTARATYAKSFFETAGLHVVAYDDDGEADSLREAVSEHGATLSCLCSTDASYPPGHRRAHVLQNTDVQRRYVAGHPPRWLPHWNWPVPTSSSTPAATSSITGRSALGSGSGLIAVSSVPSFAEVPLEPAASGPPIRRPGVQPPRRPPASRRRISPGSPRGHRAATRTDRGLAGLGRLPGHLPGPGALPARSLSDHVRQPALARTSASTPASSSSPRSSNAF